MKFMVTMKDPDTLHDAIADAVREELAAVPGLNAEERAAVAEVREAAAREAAAQWFEHGEYLTVEIDTDAETATVCPASQ